jgi:hypothetical protein
VEAFEQFVALAMEAEGFVVSEALKFPVRRQTKKTAYPEFQLHGYEVDLVGARADRLVLASVKSFFGSTGVKASDIFGGGKNAALYKMLNEPDIRDGLVEGAAARFGYATDQVEMRFYVGKFQNTTSEHAVRAWADTQRVGGGPLRVFGAADVVGTVRKVAGSKTYRDNAVLATLKVLDATGQLR